MTTDPIYRRLVEHSLLALGASLAVVAFCYFWIDRPVAFFVYDHQLAKTPGLVYLTYPPASLQTWSPLVLTLLVVRRTLGPLKHWELTLLVACLGLIVADEFRESLGNLCGRYWPETWQNNNPSLIGTGAYGFQPFKTDDFSSMPSGHAARIFGFATVWWLAVPRSRMLCLMFAAPMLVSLVVMDYHFVGDVILGSVIGAIVGTFAARLANLDPREPIADPLGVTEEIELRLLMGTEGGLPVRNHLAAAVEKR